MKRYYLAYGSNLNRRQMRYRCPDAMAIGTAWIDGYELLFKGSKTGAYLTIEENKRARVPVAVWAVSPKDEERLDIYEGCPDFYYKKDFKVTLEGWGDEIDAFAYIMHEDRKLGTPSEFYMETCAEGYGDFNLDTAYLHQAYRKSSRRKTA